MTQKPLLVVLGAGESGMGAAFLGVQKGYEVFVSDKAEILTDTQDFFRAHGIEFESAQHDLERMKTAQWVVKSPGIPDESAIVQGLKILECPVISEIEFASMYTQAKLIVITGSNGKTTTALMTHKILKDAGYDVGLAGNIGTSFARLLSERDRDYFVLEVSSFQLDGIRTFAPHISMITNITPDHLDRYGNSFERYVQSKLRIFENQTKEDHLVYCSDDSVLFESVTKSPSPVQK
ncbi:MAG: Mur ligase family protein, partial [Flavobacteriaceae bacterium]